MRKTEAAPSLESALLLSQRRLPVAVDDGPPIAPLGNTDPGSPSPPVAEPSGTPLFLLGRLAAGASLGYFSTHPSRILSEMHFDFPFIVVRQKSVYVRGQLQTSTVKTGSSIRIGSFEAQDLEYLLEAGARDYLNNRVAIAAFLGQEGREQLDQGGSRQVRYVGLGFESVGFPKPGGPDLIEWRLALGPTFNTAGVESDAVVRGALLFDLWRGRSSNVGLDGSFNSIFDGLHGQTEYRIGPRWTYPMANGIRATIFAEWIRGRNPLGLSAQGWNLGFHYTEGAYAAPHTALLPNVRGILSFGRGDSRGFGRFDLNLASPEFHLLSRPSRLFADLDANALAGSGIDNLYYIARLGVETGIRSRLLAGASVFHRSNHTIGAGSSSATSMNIVQLGVRTAGWDYADRLPGRLVPGPDATWRDRLEAYVAPGIVTDGSFARGRSWDLQVGARADLVPRSRRIVPFVRLFGEWGDVSVREGSVGFSTRQNFVIELRCRRDDQYFGRDLRETLLQGSIFF